MATLIFDCEVAPNAFGLGIKRVEDGRKVWYEFSEWDNFDRERVRRALKRNRIVGFNSASFDLPLIYMALDGASNEELMGAATRIIEERIPYWQASRIFDVFIPNLDHIDLFDTNPSVKNGLKALAGRLRVKLLQELPFQPNTHLTREEWVAGRDYCLNGDLEATHALFDMMQEPIKLREALGEDSGLELRSSSDAQVGERLIKKSVEDKTGTRIQRVQVKEGSTFRYDAPEWIKFETAPMQEILDQIKNTDFVIGKGGKVTFPKEFSAFDITFDGMQHTLGIGGLHSTEANRAVHSDADNVLIDGDVASQYPSIIMKLGLFPEAMGRDFLTVYGQIMQRRLTAKKRAKEVSAEITALEAQLAEMEKNNG